MSDTVIPLAAPATPGPAALALPAELTIYTAAELHPQWLRWLEEVAATDAPARADAQAVDQVDAAGLQLLLSLAQALAGRERQLELQGPSPALQQACAALGLQAWLQAHLAAAALAHGGTAGASA